MSELTTDVSWLSVISGFVISFLLGWAWFSTKMFGTKWAEGVGQTKRRKSNIYECNGTSGYWNVPAILVRRRYGSS